MIKVEVILNDAIELWSLPSTTTDWMEDNIAAIKIVYDDLVRRAMQQSTRLDGMRISARNTEFHVIRELRG
jgi:hypothetical protein